NTGHKPLDVVVDTPCFAKPYPPRIGYQQCIVFGGCYRMKGVFGPKKRLWQTHLHCSAIQSISAWAFKCFSWFSAAGSESTTTAPPAPMLKCPSSNTMVRMTT